MGTPGSGLSGSFGLATETTVGTPVPVTRFVEIDSETLSNKKQTSQGAGLRGGAIDKRAARRTDIARAEAGDVNFAVTTNQMGLLLAHMFGGTTPTPTALGSGLYRSIFNVGTVNGLSFTTQIVRPDTSGVLTQNAYTYPGSKITDWELSAKAGEQLKAKLSIDALDVATPSNVFLPTTLAAAASVGATTISTVAAIPVGSYIVVDPFPLTPSGGAAEVFVVTASTGTGPYTLTLATPAGQTPAAAGLVAAHAAGAVVRSATGTVYPNVAMQTPVYSSTTSEFTFKDASLVKGGLITTSSGLFVQTGGRTLATVADFTLAVKRTLKTDRYQAGSMIRNEQLEAGFLDMTLQVTLDLNSRQLFDEYLAGHPVGFAVNFAHPSGAGLSLMAAAAFLEDGADPELSGPDVLQQKLSYTILNDGVNGSLQGVWISTDSAL